MRKIVQILVGIVVFLTAVAESAEPADCSLRDGLPFFVEKLRNGKPVTVVYFGGSITYDRRGWRVLVSDWLNRKHPNVKFRHINAGLGGTGSSVGFFRLEKDVLAHSPDLVFVEFAVNDRNKAALYTQRCMEGIVRKIRSRLPNCDICFVYTATAQDLKNFAGGTGMRSVEAMEKVAEHYRLPSVFLAADALRLYKKGKLRLQTDSRLELRRGDGKLLGLNLMETNGAEFGIALPVRVDREGCMVFSRDGVHPLFDTGHRLYFNVLRRALSALPPQSSAPRSLPEPLDEDNLAAMKTVLPDPRNITGGVAEKLSKRSAPGRIYQNEIWKLPAGSEMLLEFNGSMLLLNTLYGPDCGWIEYSVDGGKPVRVLSFTPHSTGYAPANIMVPAGTAGRHQLRLRVLNESVNKKKILRPNLRSSMDKNPERFRETNFYLRFILAR